MRSSKNQLGLFNSCETKKNQSVLETVPKMASIQGVLYKNILCITEIKWMLLY